MMPRQLRVLKTKVPVKSVPPPGNKKVLEETTKKEGKLNNLFENSCFVRAVKQEGRCRLI